jgi:hypothetical protein
VVTPSTSFALSRHTFAATMPVSPEMILTATPMATTT